MPIAAGEIDCPHCGAPARPADRACHYCGQTLAVVSCPGCFAMQFAESKFCAHCGTYLSRTEESGGPPLRCSRCREVMKAVAVGLTHIEECPACGGTWVQAATFEELCRERDDSLALLGAALPVRHDERRVAEANVRYVPCPECRRLMNRVNFAHCSGVIVDVCKAHGIWFDADELRRIVIFVSGGGLEKARAGERADVEAALERLREEGQAAEARVGTSFGAAGSGGDGWARLLSAAGGLLSLFETPRPK